jgi:hypothetical protein
VLFAACVGEAPPSSEPDGTGGDPLPAAQSERVTGKAMDYFVANKSLQGVALVTDGINPQLTTMSAADGAFTFETVPVGSQIFVSASRTSYRPTRNLVTVDDTTVAQDLYLMSTTDVNRQYTTAAGRGPTAGRAFVVADLLRNNGTPMAGVALSGIKLVDAAGAPAAGVLGPYVLGDSGDIVIGPTQTETHAGKARVAFLDAPAGSLTLKISYTDGQGQAQTVAAPVTTAADGATLVRTGGTGTGGTAPGGGTQAPQFAADIYPRLQTAANGGRGCANCHTAGGLGAVAVFNALPADVLAALKAKSGLLDTAKPAQSLLLTKPLYEQQPAVQNHPNATFVDGSDPDYKLILLWIQQGAQL